MEVPRVLHIISGLDTGGAEMMLYKVLAQSSGQSVKSKVISLKTPGPIAEKIERAGFDVQTLHLGKGFWRPAICLPLLIWKTIRFRPSVIQGWMYHGNLFATVSSFFVSRHVILCWNIRQTLYDINREKIFTRWIIWLCKMLSDRPEYILYNSSLSARQHEDYGYRPDRRTIIFNGFQLEEFKSNPQIKSRVKKELSIDSQYTIGHIARFHPKKDHKTFFYAARRILAEIEDVTFVFIGRDVLFSNSVLARYVKELGLEGNVRLLGERTDISRVLTAMDVVVSSSGWGEGFSNIIGEALTVGCMCVVTDVGDAKDIVGDAGIVVPPKSVDRLAAGVIQVLRYSEEKRDEISRRGRERIIENYSIEKITEQYLSIYRCENDPMSHSDHKKKMFSEQAKDDS